MRYGTRLPLIPRIDTFVTVGFVWYAGIGIAAAITVIGATSLGDAISAALLAGLAGVAAALPIKYRRDYQRWMRDARSSAPVVRLASDESHDDSEDRARAA